MTRSIFSRLFLSYIVVILLVTVTLGALMAYLVRGQVVENKRLEMMKLGHSAAAALAPVLDNSRLHTRLEVISKLLGTRTWVVDKQGTLLAGNPPARWLRNYPEDSQQIEALFAGAPQSWVRSGRRQADPSIIVGVPLPGAAATPAAVFLYTPIAGVNQTVQALDRLLLLSLILGTLVAALLGFFISRGLTRPLADISHAAARFAAGDYASRTAATGGDEIGGLGRTFNTMAESLAKTEYNRREFLANVSHELKTPVASIQALAEALADGVASTPEHQQRYLATIVGESQRIDRLIRDLLDLSQLEAGELSIVPEKTDLVAFLSREAANYGHLLAEKNLTLRVDAPAAVPPVLADTGRLAQIVANLVSNAVRHSPAGETIVITVQPAAGKVAVAVGDRGPGIPPEDQPYIWDRFYRVDKSRARSGGGTGLGLAITKRLVQAMDGEITVESTPGQGAKFTFTLPVA
ncbi:ATP-binding protein [Anaeroselena agilis]|uniref:histidine kinase n=1 Tax=Anaeroselena agilis TaxID=3063788 RepID=A0ABU3P151_9FIRM|nr:HAMP domain-containing sensor histidine kinase [Selenomonadales bacterium 4137-cl]